MRQSRKHSRKSPNVQFKEFWLIKKTRPKREYLCIGKTISRKIQKNQQREMEIWFKEKTRPRTNYEWIGKSIKKTIRSKKSKKQENVKVTLPHVNKNPQARKGIFVQTPFSHYIKIRATNFTPQNHSLFRSIPVSVWPKSLLQFDFKIHEIVWTDLEKKSKAGRIRETTRREKLTHQLTWNLFYLLSTITTIMLIILNNTNHLKTRKSRRKIWPEKTMKDVIKTLHWVAS